MSAQVSSESPYKARAIILLSGRGQISVIDEAIEILNTYSLTIIERQDIDIAGLIISAIHIGFDPAHANAIEKELFDAMSPHGLDVALDLV